MEELRREFLKEMHIGLQEADDAPMSKKKSCLKMLRSHCKLLPNGNEKGLTNQNNTYTHTFSHIHGHTTKSKKKR